MGTTTAPKSDSSLQEVEKTLPSATNRPGPDKILTDVSEGVDTYSTDVGDVSWNVPTVHFFAATYVPGTAAHSWQATAAAGSSIGRKGMAVAARTLALSLVDLLTDPDQIRAAKASFEKRKSGRTWTTQIPKDGKPPLDYLVKKQ